MDAPRRKTVIESLYGTAVSIRFTRLRKEGGKSRVTCVRSHRGERACTLVSCAQDWRHHERQEGRGLREGESGDPQARRISRGRWRNRASAAPSDGSHGRRRRELDHSPHRSKGGLSRSSPRKEDRARRRAIHTESNGGGRVCDQNGHRREKDTWKV